MFDYIGSRVAEIAPAIRMFVNVIIESLRYNELGISVFQCGIFVDSALTEIMILAQYRIITCRAIVV